MSDDGSLIPISDEQAKLGQELVKAVRDGSSYFTDILGDLPKDLIGLLIGDRVKAKRIERMVALWQKTRERLQDRRIDPQLPSLKYAIPILEAAAVEENEELQDLWSRLLAAAMDPNRRDAMRQSFLTVVKQMDPTDVLVFKAIYDHGRGVAWVAAANVAIARDFKRSTDKVMVSINHLDRLGCISGGYDAPYLMPFGNLLMNVVSG
jgi:Abortive infection alpha